MLLKTWSLEKTEVRKVAVPLWERGSGVFAHVPLTAALVRMSESAAAVSVTCT